MQRVLERILSKRRNIIGGINSADLTQAEATCYVSCSMEGRRLLVIVVMEITVSFLEKEEKQSLYKRVL